MPGFLDTLFLAAKGRTLPGGINFFGRTWRNAADFWHSCLFASFWLSLAIFPIGYGAREVMPLLCLLFLLLYYWANWPNCVIRRLRVAWLFLPAGVMSLIGIVFSTDPWASFLHVGANASKAFILPFIAMECVRGLKDLRRLAWACAFACFWQGLDGVWQALTGHDFIMGYTPHNGRLTGSLGDYSVGNYLALALVPAFGIWYMLREETGRLSAVFLMFAIFWPAFFLFQGASSRSGVLAIAGAFGLWAILRHGLKSVWIIIWSAMPFLVFALFQGVRFMPAEIINDNRWDLWGLAWKVFEQHPWLGAGAGQYNAAFRALGLAPQKEAVTISHPHDLYLDMLYAHGIIGFALGMVFILGFLCWGFAHIMPHIRKPAANPSERLYWILCAWFWLGYAAWLFNGIFGHDFYRIWWLAIAMCNLGVMAGAIVNGERMAWERPETGSG